MDRLPFSHGHALVLSRWHGQIEKSLAARELLRDGQKILVAVSGGVDSMLLLHLLHHLAGTHHWKLTVAHFNHQLRGAASEADERRVVQTARRLGLKAVVGRGNVASAARAAGTSQEMAGRKLRHDFLARTARKLGISSVALAHHADDQVELFFLRLLRGTSGRGLAGMLWSSPSPSDPSVTLVRPFLDQTKDALREAAQAADVSHAEDATNASLDIRRNRIRHELLPLLRAQYQPRLSQRVLSLMELMGAEADLATDLAGKWLASKQPTRFDRLALAVQRRVIYAQLLHLGAPFDFNLVERLRAGHERVAIGTGQWVSRDAGGLLRAHKVEMPGFAGARMELDLKAGKGQGQFGDLTLKWEIIDRRGERFVRKPNVEFFDADKVGGTVWLRHWQPGDRFQPIGMKSPRKLQDLFTDLKVPRGERHRRVVAATDRGELFWVEGLRMAEGFKLEPGTVRRLEWKWRAKL